MRISSNFDAGNIKVVSAESEQDIQLRINPDNQSSFYQWFYFKLESQANVAHRIVIGDLANSAYPKGWEDYRAVASYDRKSWFRVDTQFDGEQLTIEHTLHSSQIYFAYFAPYSYEQHLDLIAFAQSQPLCQAQLLGHSLDGRDLTALVIGEPADDKKSVWITARQHPGETMAEWLAEGLIQRLLDNQDGMARALLEKVVFYVVPNMNPDGAVRGHLRTNAAGVNLNREWASPSMQQSPEVYLVKQKMQQIEVDLYLDIHGDEALAYNFVAGCEGNPGYNSTIAALEARFKQALLSVTPEFQDTFGYAKDEPGQANMTLATNAIGQAHNCLAFTLEMPFKDNCELPDPVNGWSPKRCAQLGKDLLVAVNAVVPHI